MHKKTRRITVNADIREPNPIQSLFDRVPVKEKKSFTYPALRTYLPSFHHQHHPTMAAQITISCGISPPKLRGYQEMAVAIGISSARLMTLRASFRACETIVKTRNLNSQANKQAFITEVTEWLAIELSDADVTNIYGRPDPEYLPSLTMYAILRYFKNHPARVRRRAREGPAGELGTILPIEC